MIPVNKSVQTLMGHLGVLVEMGSGLAVMGGAVMVSVFYINDKISVYPLQTTLIYQAPIHSAQKLL